MIVSTEIESTHGSPGQQRLVYYRCQDHLGNWHSYGPVISNDPAFDAEAHKAVAAVKVADALAEAEFEQVIQS